MTMPMSKETIVQLLATDDLYRVTVAEHLLANRPVDIAAKALRDAADRLDDLARIKFDAACRIWEVSGYGDKDPGAGNKALKMAGWSGQQESDAAFLRRLADRLEEADHA